MNTFQKGDGLLIIDVQNDFCPGGALAIKAGDRIIPVLNYWIQKAREMRVPVYASRDWHPYGHISFKEQGGLWPPHCIQDSEGAEFHPALHLPDYTVKITKGVRFDHDQNSVFNETGLTERLKRDGVQRLFVGGLALEVCVLASVLDARKAGFEVQVIADATRAVNDDDGRQAMSKMKESGAGMVTTETEDPEVIEACQKAPEWAEHARLEDTDQPCDDGRSGNIS
ncbi:MAG: nicotinamidase [Desulfobacterales bacterium]|jgi:nicotinamidase/pyrazinamidase